MTYVEDTNNNSNKELPIVVRRVTPVLLEDPNRELICLSPQGCCKLVLGSCFRHGRLASFGLESCDLLIDSLCIVTLSPFGIPVDFRAIGSFTRLCSGLEDELGNVLLWWAVETTLAEILDDFAAVLANRAEVECVSSGAIE